ncbi:MAG: AMP-binding protein [Halieaceae bacterium]|nr:AMP-binding protein [Halieaceae bacterium]
MTGENQVRQPLQLLYDWEQREPDRVYLRQIENGQFIDFTWGQLADRVRRLAAWLRAKGYGDGERIAIYSKNTYDWFVCDLAIAMAGCVSVPLYAGQAAEQIHYILDHSNCQLAFVGKLDDATSWQEGCPKSLPQVAMYKCPLTLPESTEAIHESTEPLQDNPLLAPDALFSIVYTSGTTGTPKGVMLTVDMMTALDADEANPFKTDRRDRMISYLPLAHIAERILVQGASLVHGYTIGFAESTETFIRDLKMIEPTVFFSVPRLYTKFKQGIEAKLPPSVIAVARRVPGLRGLLGNFIRKQLGFGAVRAFIVGAAPTPPEVLHWYKTLGMPLLQGYAMTENMSYGVGATTPDYPEKSVGKPLPGVEVKISDNEEILFRGSTVMHGYYLEPEKTAETVIDGWLHTGDSGHLDDEGFLYVTGRISETFKTAKGKFINPTVVENRFGDQSLLEQLCVIGLGMPAPVLAATPSELGKTMPREEFAGAVKELVEHVNDQCEAHQKMAGVLISDVDWTPENRMLTPTLKMRRRQIDEVFRPIAQAAGSGDFVRFVNTAS